MPVRKFERILVAIADPAAGATKAIRRASALARDTGASIELFNAIPSAMSPGSAHSAAEQFTRFEAAQNRRLLERMANRMRREELIVSTNVQTGYPVHTAILRQVRISKADLLVIEARKHNVFARLLLTQTDFELIRRCPVPLLIVKGRAAWRSPRILAAIDPFHSNDKPSALDGEIIAAAGAVAGLARGSVHAAHIYLPSGAMLPTCPWPRRRSPAYLRRRRRIDRASGDDFARTLAAMAYLGTEATWSQANRQSNFPVWRAPCVPASSSWAQYRGPD